MKYYSYYEYEPNRPYIVTKSEEDIRKEYWSYWYDKMCMKYEQAYVDENYSLNDCIEDWVVVHWAWASDKSGNKV